MSKTVGIVGCGWLGMPLAQHLLQKGYVVKGSKTTVEGVAAMEAIGIEGHQLVLSPALECSTINDFLNCDVLVVNFPPKRRGDIETYYPRQMAALVAAVEASPVQHVIFISSTSVYPNNNRLVEEENLVPEKPSGKALLKAEAIWHNNNRFTTTTLRFSGLIGYDRMPGRFLAGKKQLKNGNAPVNLIHQDDCVAIIREVMEQEIWGKVFNACADAHPLRKDFYTKAALQIGLEPPVFTGDDDAYKIISSKQLKLFLGYTFIHPDPMQLIDA